MISSDTVLNGVQLAALFCPITGTLTPVEENYDENRE